MYLNFIVNIILQVSTMDASWPNTAGYLRKANKNAFMPLLNFYIAIIR